MLREFPCLVLNKAIGNLNDRLSLLHACDVNIGAKLVGKKDKRYTIIILEGSTWLFTFDEDRLRFSQSFQSLASNRKSLWSGRVLFWIELKGSSNLIEHSVFISPLR